ncbi:hypothetical protein ACVW06_000104 [Pantoea ananatis]|uniref:hypothetical protein n=1 Tax=Pantoea ananas TaxID=553 RepID=UPI001B310C6A|nr:hypothetical protein [Pantoea ananatis]
MNFGLKGKTLQEDLRDLTKLRPAKPASRVEVIISVNWMNGERQRAFAASLTDYKLSLIRELGKPTVSIFFPAVPVVTGNNDPFLHY